MKIGKIGRLSKGNPICGNCHAKLDGFTGVDHGNAPSPGDFTICGYCGHLQVFTKKMNLRNLNNREIREAAGNKSIVDAQKIRPAIYGRSKLFKG